jgi:hypothetical protein
MDFKKEIEQVAGKNTPPSISNFCEEFREGVTDSLIHPEEQ